MQSKQGDTETAGRRASSVASRNAGSAIKTIKNTTPATEIVAAEMNCPYVNQRIVHGALNVY